MTSSTSYLISALVVVGAWGGHASAQDEPPPPEGLTDDDLARLSQAETIEIFDERPDKPFDRDTTVRLTGEQLAARGATDLATALSLLPDVTVRDAGRGGFNLDIRGARKGAVSVLIDGVVVSDPYYGTFDVSTIPITDIVQIRVSTTPQSPIDGPGGPGGVVEVLTRDAVGDQIIIARVTGDSLPTFGLTGTARAPITKHTAIRISGSGLGGARDMDLPGDLQVGEQRRAATGSARLEYRKGDRRIAIDGSIDDRHYVAPPSDTLRSNILLIDREQSVRAQIKADDKIGSLQLQGAYYVAYLHRKSRQFVDPEFANEVNLEDLAAIRSGGMLLATRPFAKDFRWAVSAAAEHDKVLVIDENAAYVRGDITLLNAAVDVQYERKKVRVDVAGGLAMPFGVGASPWPEAKISAKYKIKQELELTATTGYKGRVPSLRERYDSLNGNTGLGPEKALHAEVRAIEERDRVRIEVAPFYRRTNGTIRGSTVPEDLNMLVNLGDLDIYGIDTQAKIQLHAKAEVGGAYNYVHASSDTSDQPLDRLPRHRFDAWARVFATKNYSALARVKYFGASTDKGTDVGGYTLVEANLTAQLTPTYLGVLRVDDLLDVAPQTRNGYHMPGRVISVVLQGAWQ